MVPKKLIVFRWITGMAFGVEFDWDLCAMNLWCGIFSIMFIWNIKEFRENLHEISKENSDVEQRDNHNDK